MKHLFIATFILFLTACGTNAQKKEIFSPEGKAIKGYDPVAFFREQKAVKGSEALSYTWKDAQWLFSTKENLDSFKANPEHYAPQYGGYCAYGTAQGHKAPTETNTWTIVDNKLYFNYDSKVRESWIKDTKGLIEKADKEWINIKDKE
jgi:YHS domain-containing protein